ncbi:MAG: hypothetical protein JWN65_1317 [Solirubrobacterales bacterium]|nr:hypothetical protein [Solirubrobacterales bacterium]
MAAGFGRGRVGPPAKVRTHASSAGETKPRASNRTRAGRALNRRVELTVAYR